MDTTMTAHREPNSKISASKVILHMDGDAFFVAVEVAKNPKLKGLPVVTGAERGIVSAFSYEAKALGIKRAMPIYKVRKQFPQVIVLPGDYKAYTTYSRAMFDIVRRYADDVEEYSIDECFADLTGLDKPLKMSYLEIATKIKKEINEELGLSVTIGLAPTKVLAKVASKWQKPNGLTIITQETIGTFLSTFSIDRIWGVGPRTSRFLRSEGIHTAQDFLAKDMRWVHANLSVNYEVIWKELSGVSVININPEVKTVYSSIQRTRTFHPATSDKEFLLTQLSKHTEDACAKARQYNLSPKKISFHLRTKELRYITYAFPLPAPTNSPETIIMHIREMFHELYKVGAFYRATGVTLHGLTSSSSNQGTLFDTTTKADKFEALHRSLDALEHKLGKRVVHLGSTHSALKHMTEDIDPEDGERHLLFT